MFNFTKLTEFCQLIRRDIITSTTAAGSGHPTSCLSAVELMTTLFFNYFDRKHDKLIFSKGHAAPLLYALYHQAGLITTTELMSLRQFDSPFEGHPTPRFEYVDVATGSLGQGLSIGVGMALGIKIKDNKSSKVYVLLGDSEMAEGQVWEAMAIASYYKLNNLIGIIDVNRLGQRGETMLGWDLTTYQKRIEAFGWKTSIIDDGNDLQQVTSVFKLLNFKTLKQPLMLIARTVKGKGVPAVENQNGWHGKVIPAEKLELDEINKKLESFYAKL